MYRCQCVAGTENKNKTFYRLVLGRGGGIHSASQPNRRFFMKCNKCWVVTGYWMLLHTAENRNIIFKKEKKKFNASLDVPIAVLWLLGKDLSVRSLIKAHELFSNLHSIILPSNSLRYFVYFMEAKGWSYCPTKSNPNFSVSILIGQGQSWIEPVVVLGFFFVSSYPIPLCCVIFSLKSTEFMCDGFHFKTLLQAPDLYGCNIGIESILFADGFVTIHNACDIIPKLLFFLFFWEIMSGGGLVLNLTCIKPQTSHYSPTCMPYGGLHLILFYRKGNLLAIWKVSACFFNCTVQWHRKIRCWAGSEWQ